MTDNKRYRKVLGLIQNTDGELFDLSEIADLLNNQDEHIKDLEMEIKELKKELAIYKIAVELYDGDD